MKLHAAFKDKDKISRKLCHQSQMWLAVPLFAIGTQKGYG